MLKVVFSTLTNPAFDLRDYQNIIRVNAYTIYFQMLQLAGIQCEGKPELLVTDDGSYSEVGQKDIRGTIWAKVCS